MAVEIVDGKITCEKCHRSMATTKFYRYKNGDYCELCKECLTMHLDNFDEDTYIWILQKLDYPYIPEEWNFIRDREYAKKGDKLTGMSVLGRYISSMNLGQFRSFDFEHSDEAREKSDKYRKSALYKTDPQQDLDYVTSMKQKLENGEISNAEYMTMVGSLAHLAEDDAPPEEDYGVEDQSATFGSFYNENDYLDESDLPDPGASLTEDDKIYLAMKWGRLYKPNEWVELEQQYNEMTKSFDIQDADTEATLILICKTNLKMNQSLDAGDMEGFQKLSRVYDTLRKSAKFTAAQNKEEKENFVDSVGELVALCEREEGFIPRFASDIPQDKVDATLKDMNDYTYKLVTQDLGFGQQIEDALKKIQIQKEMDEDVDEESRGNEVDLEDSDFEDYFEEIAEQQALDALTENGSKN